MKILIPTCRALDELSGMIAAIEKNAPGCEVVASCRLASASVNRNHCLDHISVGDIAIMLDDDIEGFYPGWVDDLTEPLRRPEVVMVSARLLNTDGSYGQTCSRNYDSTPDEIEIKSNGVAILPTAAIAFRHLGYCFDESFCGSGFEDSDWCQQIFHGTPGAVFIQGNKCRLIHRNEMKNQHGKIWKHNQLYFWNKWKLIGATVS